MSGPPVFLWIDRRDDLIPSFPASYYNSHLFKTEPFPVGMAPMSTKPLLAALKGTPQARPPIWLMRQAGRYLPEYRALRSAAGGFLDLCMDPEKAAEVTLQPVHRFGMDAAILFSDILIVPHALGQRLAFKEGEGPVLDTADLSRLADGLIQDRVAPIYETVRRVKAGLPEGAALIGFAGSPWTVASYMVEGGGSRDYAAAKTMFFRDPVRFQALIDRIVAATIEYLSGQIVAGAEAVQLFDSWAGALAEPDFERWSIAPNAAIIAAIKARHPEIPVIAFPRGAGLLYPRFAETVGADAIGLDTAVPVEWARDTLQRRFCVQGNLDPLALAAGGDALRKEAGRILAALSDGPFVFNLGHGILPHTPPEHVAELVALVKGRAA